MNPQPLLLFLLLPLVPARGGTSAHYTLDPVVLDSGGRKGASANYSADFSSSPGGVTASANYLVRGSFAAQLREVVAIGLTLTSPDPTLDEGGNLQLGAALVFDDATTSPLNATSIGWSVLSGPLTGIDAAGLATAAAVYQDSPAVAQGTYQAFTGTLDLTVLDAIPDNFGTYAADEIGDDWQVRYFGQPPNSNAGPLLDPDHDGQTNLFEFTAGLVPTNPLSRFLLSIAPVPGQPARKKLVFGPIIAGRNYRVMTSPDLSPASWSPMSGGTISNNGDQRTVTDPGGPEARKFYRVEIVKP